MSTNAMETPSLEEKQDNRPRPDDLINFLPWACGQYQMGKPIIFTKIVQNEYISLATDRNKNKSRINQNISKYDIGSTDGKDKSSAGISQYSNRQNAVWITAYTDVIGNIVELKFNKNSHIPSLLFLTMALVIKYQIYLTKITINRGLDQYTIYEMNKCVKISHISEVNLDDTFFLQANYDILLDGPNNIRYLSLARCRINDKVLKNISEKLAYPLPASKVLSVLILSSNRITDNGVAYLAESLRSNRQLSYINLADNTLTDDGACLILDSLQSFVLTQEEILAEKRRHLQFFKDKNDMIVEMVKELRTGEFDKKVTKKKSVRPVPVQATKKGKLEKESSIKSLDAKSSPNFDFMFYDKAVYMVEEKLGDYNDPFSLFNTKLEDGQHTEADVYGVR
ncbi:uncharacterized protein LOC112056619 [Bicyclus anynana]|uniref:Uncharacterized protein LOC112056619 n=1 Tax=Bicyclus anynana TaxID=110368 RepID=A0ABM3M1P8_BICAN|nr:uncharacterized protein LOC112056619 [Bicyclus anynana]